MIYNRTCTWVMTRLTSHKIVLIFTKQNFENSNEFVFQWENENMEKVLAEAVKMRNKKRLKNAFPKVKI